MGIVSYIKEEIRVVRERDPAIKSNMEVLLYPSFRVILRYRVAHKLYLKKHYFWARWISQRAARKTGIEIHPGAKIGRGLFIDHGSGVIIGETTVIGDNVTLYQGVTLGGTGKEQGKRHPTLEDNVMVSAGAKILGSFTIGENSKIGAGSVVLEEVPPNCTVVGVPGRIVKMDNKKVPRSDMDQIHLPDPVLSDIKRLQEENLRLHKELKRLVKEIRCVEKKEEFVPMMKIYNTLSKRKEEFVPLEEGKVKMYVCGPTVYNFIHIGNARPMIAFDTVRRYFEYKGFEVNFVSNFTDVDDKIIKKAIEEGVSADEISKRYIAECKKDMEAMNVKPATKNPLATEEICGMVEMISTLIEKGYAYEKNGTVYYRTRKFEGYGKLSHKNLDDLRSGGRSLLVTGEDEKEDPLDFVLWKPKKEGEPAWESPWSEGRPGWHIECSEMSKKYLGEQIDIHAGGEDLIFPHHENEIAQSEAANGKEFAKYWMHNGFLNIDNKKMSKSLGNFFTVREIGEKYDLQILRFFMLSAHYRSPLNFSAELMEAAKNSLERIFTAADNLKFLISNTSEEKMTESEKRLFEKSSEYVEAFERAMDDDFNTADAIAAIFDLVKYMNTTADGASSKEYLQNLLDRLCLLTDVLGIIVIKEEEMLDSEIEEMIEKRQAARKDRNFALADQIRDELLAKGIILEDTREGVKWKKA